MYSQHFGLTQDPFSIAPDPRYLFMSERHREALAHLLYGVTGPQSVASGSGGGFVLLTGDIGTGKTTICRCFLEQIPPGCHVAYIFNPKLTVTELLQSICEEFHINVAPTSHATPTVKVYIDALNAFLLESHAAGQSNVLIIDEAQNLQADVLEQLRLLTNLETNARKLLQIVLIGQPELRTMLQRPELEQLAQRVIARFHLDALTEAETAQYIGHRLAIAGHTGPLPFDRASLQRIHRLARGVPRRINLLCGRALLGAWAHGLHRVNRSVVDQAASEVFGADRAPAHGGWRSTRVYVVGGLFLLLGAALAGWSVRSARQPGMVLPQAAVVPAVPAVQAPALPPSSPASVTPPVLPAPRPIEAMDALLAQLPRDINNAWNALAPEWKLSGTSDDPCQAALAQQLQCYRTSNLTMPQLRQLGRPGILTLQADQGPPVYAVLLGLADQTATLQVDSHLHTVRLIALGALWHGDFATYWRAPQGYVPSMRGGASSPAVQELANQLNQLEGMAPQQPAPSASSAGALDADLKARVRAFQRALGLKPDGQPGPMTYMQLESALGTNQPRLQTESR